MHAAGRAFVLAGGQSSRMGADKTRMSLHGVSLLERSIHTLRVLGFTVAVAGLLDQSQPCTAPIVPDAFPGSGPLGGVEAALRSISSLPPQPVLFLAVDLPLLPAGFLKMLWNRALTTGALATVPYFTGRPQPHCAVYDSSLAAGIHAALTRDDRKVMRVLEFLVPADRFDRFRVEALPSALLPAPSRQDEAPMHRWFANVNTPVDWRSMQAFAGVVSIDTASGNPVTDDRNPPDHPSDHSSDQEFPHSQFSGGVPERSGISQPAGLPAPSGAGAKWQGQND